METKINKYLKDAHYMIGALLKDHKKELSGLVQPYQQGTLVQIVEELPHTMPAFEPNHPAVVIESTHSSRLEYEYALFVLHTNEEGEVHGHHSAWYPHSVLIKLEDPTEQTLQVVEYSDFMEEVEDEDLGDDCEDSADDYEDYEEEEHRCSTQ
jgi:hypothetical protein